ncbi:hypothetical protein EsH8_IX_000259 [Colletotrichum jinshuiense]
MTDSTTIDHITDGGYALENLSATQSATSAHLSNEILFDPHAQRPQPENDATFTTPNIADPRLNTPRKLTKWDVAALIVNKMIGTGIFMGPFTVIENTQNKGLVIGFWVIGFFYTIMSLVMYLEYARKLPFTGGELVYLDDVFTRYPLLTYTLYAFYFVFLYTTSTNAMQFAAQVLMASKGSVFLEDAGVDERLLRLLAVMVTTAISMLLYLSNSRSRQLNIATAAAKVLLLLVVCIFGACYLKKYGAHMDDWSEDNGQPDGSRRLLAFVTILFSFHGWENATLVAGEIPEFSVLRDGAMWAVGVVGILYILVATLVCSAFSWDQGPLQNYMAEFFSVADNSGGLKGTPSEKAAVAAATIIALSSIGSMISVAYTCVRVKQSIGWTNILLFSRIWKRSGPLRAKYEKIPRETGAGFDLRLQFDGQETPYNYPGTPEGGIILHWFVTVFYICITAIFGIRDAIDFSANLLVYGHFFIESLVGLGFTWFDSKRPTQLPPNYPTARWLPEEYLPDGTISWPQPPSWLRKDPWRGSVGGYFDGLGQTVLGIFILLFSAAMLIAECFTTKGLIVFGVNGVVFFVASIYWLLLVRKTSTPRKLKWLGFEIQHEVHGSVDPDNMDASELCEFCETFYRSFLSDGSQSRDHRHPHHGYMSIRKIKYHGD